jgi:hypothetical protein
VVEAHVVPRELLGDAHVPRAGYVRAAAIVVGDAGVVAATSTVCPDREAAGSFPFGVPHLTGRFRGVVSWAPAVHLSGLTAPRFLAWAFSAVPGDCAASRGPACPIPSHGSGASVTGNRVDVEATVLVVRVPSAATLGAGRLVPADPLACCVAADGWAKGFSPLFGPVKTQGLNSAGPAETVAGGRLSAAGLPVTNASARDVMLVAEVPVDGAFASAYETFAAFPVGPYPCASQPLGRWIGVPLAAPVPAAGSLRAAFPA